MVIRSRNENGEVLHHLVGLTRNRTTAGLLSWMLLLTLVGGLAYAVVAADLVMTASDSPDPVTVGDNLTYSTTVTNNGIAAITALVTNALPVNVMFVSANSTQGSCTQSGGTVTCDLGS